MPPKIAAKKAAVKPAAKPAAKAAGKATAKAAAGANGSAAPKAAAAKGDPEVEGAITDLFRLADPDGSGVLEFKEFLKHHRNLMSATEIGDNEDDTEIEQKFRMHDADNNQCLDKAEFALYMKGLFSVIGRKQFLAICKVIIAETEARLQEWKASIDGTASIRLLDQASSVKYFKAEQKEAALAFLDAKADPNEVDKTGSHCLIYAADRCDDVFIKQLLDRGANPDLHNKAMECAAFRAAKVRNLDVLEVLLMNRDKVLVEGAVEKRLALSRKLVRSMGESSGAAVKELLKQNADPNFKDETGWTPLTAAVFWGKKDCLEALLAVQTANSKVKLRLDKLNGKGRAPLHICARKARDEEIPLLLKVKGDPDLMDTDGWTPLHHAAYNSNNGCVAALVKCGANMMVQGRYGMTAYMATRLKSRAGNLNDKMLKLLEPPQEVNFGKAMLPIFKDESLTTFWDKLQAVLNLPGVHGVIKNLRIYDQCFDPATGPNKVKLQKLWEELACPLIKRLRLGVTDLDPPPSNWTPEAKADRAMEIETRQKDQRLALEGWLWETRGPRKVEQTWDYSENRPYREEMDKVVAEELQAFQTELDRLYAEVKEEEGGDRLTQEIPADEVLDKRFLSQLGAHPIPAWVQQVDAAGAFEALRAVGAFGGSGSDEECLSAFSDLFLLDPDFDSGKEFWRNSYRLWLSLYAKMANGEFQRRVSAIVQKFNKMYSEDGVAAANLRSVQSKNIESMKSKERRIGTSSAETWEGRTVAAGILDMVRCSITVSKASHVVALLDDFFREIDISNDKLKLVRCTNRFNEKAETLIGYRDVVLNVYMDFGSAAAACGRPKVRQKLSLVGEIQIVLSKFIAVRKRRHLLFKYTRGVYDWPKEALPENVANLLVISKEEDQIRPDEAEDD